MGAGVGWLRQAVAVFCGLMAVACGEEKQPEADARPNILLILADDLGLGDISAYGSEIDTPNIDRLIAEGVSFRQFYAAPTCSPTRAMLLTGVDHHKVGLGSMGEIIEPEQKGRPGYEGYLNDRAETIARRLQDAGYFTALAGKWHLGLEPEHGPDRRGFERSFALLEGGASHFGDARALGPSPEKAAYREDGKPVDLPDDFFSSAFYTDKMIAYIEESRVEGKPFFGYLAYTAPHWPLQAPDDWIDRYKGVYDDGYEALATKRFDAMKARGLIPADTVPHPLPHFVRPWDGLTEEERRIEARKMEVYAAMVANLDHHVGRMLDYLERTGALENTIIVFLSDNGPEGNQIGAHPAARKWLKTAFDNSYRNMGRINSYVFYGPGWARAGTPAHRLFKAFTTEGGVRVPAVIWQGGKAGRASDAIVSVMDIAPTLADLAELPGAGENGPAAVGRSLKGLVDGGGDTVRDELSFELFGRRGIRQGDWKAVRLFPPYGPGRWELFDLSTDPGETRDLAVEQPEVLARLIARWEDYAAENGVVVLDYDSGYGKVGE